MKRIGLLSDTHGYMDDRILHHLKGCDEIWHAGDIGSHEVMKPLHDLAEVRAVYGNIDEISLRSTYPLDNIFETAGAKCYITHIAGRPGKYPARVKEMIRANRPNIFICGHSHILIIQRDPKSGMIHLNPGAAGKHGFHKMRTMIRFAIEKGQIVEPEIIELGKRGV
jgi:putative phosphoesterase